MSIFNTFSSLASRLLLLSLLGGCLIGCSTKDVPFVYRIDIPQGNILTDEDIERLEVGMTREQVSFLLGTPLLVDPFHQDQWEYVYLFKPGSTKSRQGVKGEEQLLRVYFKNDVVEHFSFVEKEEKD